MKCTECNQGSLVGHSRWCNDVKMYDFYECDFCKFIPIRKPQDMRNLAPDFSALCDSLKRLNSCLRIIYESEAPPSSIAPKRLDP
jgi:hypothetical protein